MRVLLVACCQLHVPRYGAWHAWPERSDRIKRWLTRHALATLSLVLPLSRAQAAIEQLSGWSIVANTSFNVKARPMINRYVLSLYHQANEPAAAASSPKYFGGRAANRLGVRAVSLLKQRPPSVTHRNIGNGLGLLQRA
jgi:hypothetical protein